MRFQDRSDAGRQLVAQLSLFANHPDIRVLALPRGGVPIAFEIARELRAPLDVWVVRKLGTPRIPELAVGAIGPGGIQVIDPSVAQAMHMSPELIAEIAARERLELDRREAAYRPNRPPIDVRGKTAILVDDGLATGSTMRAAVAALRRLEPARIIVAVPVAAESVCARLALEADQVVCLFAPIDLDSVGQWYDDFSQTTDAEVTNLLSRAAAFTEPHPA